MKTSVPRSCETGFSPRRCNPARPLLWLAILTLLPLGCSKGQETKSPPAPTGPTPTVTPALSTRPSHPGQVLTGPAFRATPRPTPQHDLESSPTSHSPGSPPKATSRGQAAKPGTGSIQTTPVSENQPNSNGTDQPTSPGAGPAATRATSLPGATPIGKASSEAATPGPGQEDVLRQFVNAGGTPASTSGENENANSSSASGTSQSGEPVPTPKEKWTHPTPAPTIGPPTDTPPAPTPDAGQVSVYVYPPNMPSVVGKSFTLMVMMDSFDKPVADYTASVLYNPLKIRFDGFRNGDDPFLGNIEMKMEEKDQNGQPRGVLHILTVQTASKDRPIGSRIMVARLDFTAIAPGDTRVEIAGATVDNTSQDRMQVGSLGGSLVSITAPPQP